MISFIFKSLNSLYRAVTITHHTNNATFTYMRWSCDMHIRVKYSINHAYKWHKQSMISQPKASLPIYCLVENGPRTFRIVCKDGKQKVWLMNIELDALD